jgi:hypothetical protein
MKPGLLGNAAPNGHVRYSVVDVEETLARYLVPSTAASDRLESEEKRRRSGWLLCARAERSRRKPIH